MGKLDAPMSGVKAIVFDDRAIWSNTPEYAKLKELGPTRFREWHKGWIEERREAELEAIDDDVIFRNSGSGGTVSPRIWGQLAALVERDGRTQVEIGSAMVPPMSKAQISEILRGGRPNLKVDTVARFLTVLGKRWRDIDPYE